MDQNELKHTKIGQKLVCFKSQILLARGRLQENFYKTLLYTRFYLTESLDNSKTSILSYNIDIF